MILVTNVGTCWTQVFNPVVPHLKHTQLTSPLSFISSLPQPPFATHAPLFALTFCDQQLQSVLVSPCLTFHSSLLLIYHSIFIFIISCQGVKKPSHFLSLSLCQSLTFFAGLNRPMHYCGYQQKLKGLQG